MICPKCGKEIEDGVAFCKFCGSSVSSQNNEFSRNEANATVFQETAAPEKQKAKAKKVIIPIAIALIVVILAVIIGVVATPKYEKLKVTYNGDTQADVVLNKDNDGIIVMGITKDGTEKEIKGWSIEEEKTLQADHSSTVTITYKDLKRELTVKCSSSAVFDIFAEYDGSLSEGTTIDTSKNDVKVFAKYKNGKNTEVTEDCTFDPASVTLKKDGTEIINVKYGDFAYNLELVCADKTIKEITAKYTGSTAAGTTINSSNVNLTVTAVFADGTKETVTGWKIEQPVTLEADKESEITITYKDQSCTIKVLCSTISDAAYKNSCESISYSELARSPKPYEGKNVKFKGKIIQVLEDASNGRIQVDMRINTKWEYSSYYDDTVYVVYEMDEDSPRFLEDDIVTFYGEYRGVYTYESIFGESITIPLVVARIIERN